MKKVIALVMLAIIWIGLASAVSVSLVRVNDFEPGQQASLEVDVKNNLGDDVEDVSFSLQLSNTPFTAPGGSEDGDDEIRENKESTFRFIIKAASDAKPGQYNVPYIISYKRAGEDARESKTGTIGITIKSQPQLSYSTTQENPVVGSKGTITLKIVNDGLADARFVSVKVLPNGFNLVSDDESYIGTIDSDDFETANFDVVFSSENANFEAIVTYRDFDNKIINENIKVPVRVYTREKAEELGIVAKNNTLTYVIIAVGILVIWFLWRYLRKRRRMRVKNSG